MKTATAATDAVQPGYPCGCSHERRTASAAAIHVASLVNAAHAAADAVAPRGTLTSHEISYRRMNPAYLMLACPSNLRKAVMPTSLNCRAGTRQICGFINSNETYRS